MNSNVRSCHCYGGMEAGNYRGAMAACNFSPVWSKNTLRNVVHLGGLVSGVQREEKEPLSSLESNGITGAVFTYFNVTMKS